MENFFLSLWNRSMAAGWLILLVIVLRLVLKKAPKSLRCWLWALVGVRLAWPFSIESVLSLIPSAQTIPETVFQRDAFQVASGVAYFNTAVNEQLADYYGTVQLPAGHTRGVVLACGAVWIAGMVLMILWAAVSCLRLRRRVAEAVPEGDGVWVCDRIGSPFLLGMFRPRIYLPAGLEEENRAYVLAHERAHIRRRDHLVKPLGLLLLAVYWFHPLVWAAYLLLCRDIELACDERVVAELGETCKKPYSTALLACSVHRSGLTALAFGETGVKERVKNVLNYRKPAFWVAAACAAVLVVVGVCFLTDPVQEPEDPVSFSNLNASQPEDAKAFAAGTLLYQHMALSYMPTNGGSPFFWDGDTLTHSFYDYETAAIYEESYQLEKTVSMSWDNLYDYFPTLAEQEELYGVFLADHSDLAITARFYSDGGGSPGPSVWTVPRKNGGEQLWLYYGGRLFAFIDLDKAFPFMVNGALWTYMPRHSEILPVRFDVGGGAEVWAGPDALLSTAPRDEAWVEHLSVEEGQTVYWMPARDGDGRPMADTGLRYQYTCQLPAMNTPYQCEETLTLKPVTDGGGLYGGVTYGLSNNWLGAFSSQTHFSVLDVDLETGDLVVRTYDGSGPYQTREPGDSVGSVQGRSGEIEVRDAESGQLTAPDPADR